MINYSSNRDANDRNTSNKLMLEGVLVIRKINAKTDNSFVNNWSTISLTYSL